MAPEPAVLSRLPVNDETREALDRYALADGSVDVPTQAAIWACDRFTSQELQEAWEAFRRVVRKREALATGQAHWSEFYDEEDLPPGEHQQAAIELACAEADDARHWFLAGRFL